MGVVIDMTGASVSPEEVVRTTRFGETSTEWREGVPPFTAWIPYHQVPTGGVSVVERVVGERFPLPDTGALPQDPGIPFASGALQSS
jgi:hypothetical protein